MNTAVQLYSGTVPKTTATPRECIVATTKYNGNGMPLPHPVLAPHSPVHLPYPPTCFPTPASVWYRTPHRGRYRDSAPRAVIGSHYDRSYGGARSSWRPWGRAPTCGAPSRGATRWGFLPRDSALEPARRAQVLLYGGALGHWPYSAAAAGAIRQRRSCRCCCCCSSAGRSPEQQNRSSGV
jgi:hypothetical protein